MDDVEVAQGLIVGTGGEPLKFRCSDIDTRDVVAGRDAEGETTIGGNNAGKTNGPNYRGSNIAVHKAVNGRADTEAAKMYSLQECAAGQRVARIIRRVTDENGGIDHLPGANGPNAAVGDGDGGIADRAGHAELRESQLIRGDTFAGDSDRSVTIAGDAVSFVTLEGDGADPRRVDGGEVTKTRSAQALQPAPDGDPAAVVKIVRRDAGILVFGSVGRDDPAEEVVDLQLQQDTAQFDTGSDHIEILRVDKAASPVAGDLVNLQRAGSGPALPDLDCENAAGIGAGQGQGEGLKTRGRHRSRELQF